MWGKDGPKEATMGEMGMKTMFSVAPTTEIGTIRHGHWLKNGDRYCECSICHHEGNIRGHDNYCWFCGAKMDEMEK